MESRTMQQSSLVCGRSWGKLVDLPQNASTSICVLVPSCGAPGNFVADALLLLSTFGEMASWQVDVPSDPDAALVKIDVAFYDVRAAHKAVQHFGSTHAWFCEPGLNACRTVCILLNVLPNINLGSFGEIARLFVRRGGPLVLEYFDVRAARQAQTWALKQMPDAPGLKQGAAQVQASAEKAQASSDAQLMETQKAVEVDSVQSRAFEQTPPPGIPQSADPMDKGTPPEFCHVQSQAPKDVHVPRCIAQPPGLSTLHPHGLHPDGHEVAETPSTRSEASDTPFVPYNSSSEKSFDDDHREDFYVPSETSEDVAERQEYLAWLMSEGAQDDSAP
eukprot:TRINITY_DN1981_c0_g2_i1.p1 TRINITY_DN1981_c0_g2~~TRINITY_DN1981_c0_g2_i1.p1  ORF type:complete len:333 (+),score=64.27 TRINITY_DN1981_c0_g2_i1:70-1068(+)